MRPRWILLLAVIVGFGLTVVLGERDPARTHSALTSPLDQDLLDPRSSEFHSQFTELRASILGSPRMRPPSTAGTDAKERSHHDANASGPASAKQTPSQTYPLLDRLRQNPSYVIPTHLAEHIDINPRGMATTADVHSILLEGHARLIAPLVTMRRVVDSIRHEDLNDLANRRILRILKLRESPEVQAARDENRRSGIPTEPMFHGEQFYENALGMVWFVRHANTYFGAGPNDLKRYSAHFDAYVETCASTYSQLVTLAHSMGMLTDQDLEARLESAAVWQATHVGNPNSRL